MNAVERYRARRNARLKVRGYRKDDEETNEANSSAKKGGHGNTKLPFGLCQREGIEIGKDWTPKDAWDALAGKGITPGAEFAKRSKGQTLITSGGAKHTNVYTEKSRDKYVIKGDYHYKSWGGEERVSTRSQVASFTNKQEMFAYLKKYNITRINDPDTGKVVNPVEMDVPNPVAERHEQLFTEVILGTRYNKSGRPYERRAFTITVRDYDGKKHTVKELTTPEKALEFAKTYYKCNPDDVKRSRDFKKWKEEWGDVETEMAARYKRGSEKYG